jgi:hypothetical protein
MPHLIDRIEDATGLVIDIYSSWDWVEYERRSDKARLQIARALEMVHLVSIDETEAFQVRQGDWLVQEPNGALEIVKPGSFYKKFRSVEPTPF